VKSLLRLVPNGLGSGGKGGIRRCSGSCGKGCHSPMYVSRWERRNPRIYRLQTWTDNPIARFACNQYQYLLVVVDDFSRYVSVKPLKKKSEAGGALIEIINLLHQSLNKPSPSRLGR